MSRLWEQSSIKYKYVPEPQVEEVEYVKRPMRRLPAREIEKVTEENRWYGINNPLEPEKKYIIQDYY